MAEERLPLLLGLAFGRHMLEGQHEWCDVPEVVRTSFLLLAKELRRMHRLLLAGDRRPQSRDGALSAGMEARSEVTGAQEAPTWSVGQRDLERLQRELRDAQRRAEGRQATWKRRWTKLCAEFEALKDASISSQQQHAAISQHLCASWEGVKTQVALLEARLQTYEAKPPDTVRPSVHAVLGQLAKNQETCSQEIHRLQWALAAHDHRVMAPAPPQQPEQQERRDDSAVQPARQREQPSPLSPASLRQRCAQAWRKQQQG